VLNPRFILNIYSAVEEYEEFENHGDECNVQTNVRELQSGMRTGSRKRLMARFTNNRGERFFGNPSFT
jgi:hypothetical protein